MRPPQHQDPEETCPFSPLSGPGYGSCCYFHALSLQLAGTDVQWLDYPLHNGIAVSCLLILLPDVRLLLLFKLLSLYFKAKAS